MSKERIEQKTNVSTAVKITIVYTGLKKKLVLQWTSRIERLFISVRLAKS